ncbi:ferredoxin reductase-like protein [Coemansia reversa NRRL 1564]|uniref:NADH-cytochrome b5 reductase n=1 Tax=Coemansia reversa (strain ATCC 12441 / NRRL 1564) TaxID=763665 RepID=A0A2G5B5P2_COERN|nr:ferredoxin reductase-like protein [Coemansia reversa NRRL 1564]|eukprot:PIA14321.1 ferredoxin reductase-like protein [Coemansia reversa NRRL 1564]
MLRSIAGWITTGTRKSRCLPIHSRTRYSTRPTSANEQPVTQDPVTDSTGSGKKGRPPGTYAIWAMEVIGGASAFIYYLHLQTDLLKPKVKERLDPNKYTPLMLLEREPLTADTTRFRFRVNRPRHDSQQEELVDDIISQGLWALDVKDHLVQTYRTYTPVSYSVSEVVNDARGLREGHCDLVVKRYPRGSLSRFLHATRVGDHIEMRGPILTWPYSPGAYRRIFMLAGGTGIAPMFQLITRVLSNPDDTSTKLSLLYGSPSESDIIYRKELDALADQHPDRLYIQYLVDQGPSNIAKCARPDKEMLAAFTGSFDSSNDIMLVCGPDPMLAAICGPKPIGPSQGPLQGVLRELGFTNKDVFKF